GGKRALAADIEAAAALLQGTTYYHVAHGARQRLYAPDPLQRRGNGMAGETLRRGVVEGAAIGLADRGSHGADDQCIGHREILQRGRVENSFHYAKLSCNLQNE